jgi:hypothetical protein
MTKTVLKTLGRGSAHPCEVLNALIELDNHQGEAGLRQLETLLQAQLPRLRPQARHLALLWLEATLEYRHSHYPSSLVQRVLRWVARSGVRPMAPRRQVA